MDTEQFVRQFAEQFDDISTDDFSLDTKFKENDEWGSMTALSIIAMVDNSYSVRLTGDDIRKSSSIKDIYNIVAFKITAQ